MKDTKNEPNFLLNLINLYLRKNRRFKLTLGDKEWNEVVNVLLNCFYITQYLIYPALKFFVLIETIIKGCFILFRVLYLSKAVFLFK